MLIVHTHFMASVFHQLIYLSLVQHHLEKLESDLGYM